MRTTLQIAANEAVFLHSHFQRGGAGFIDRSRTVLLGQGENAEDAAHAHFSRHTGIKILAGFMGVYHILMGILGIASGSWAAWGAHALWHANVTVDPQFTYLAKFLGAYVVAFGVMLLFIAKDPVRYGALVYPAVVVAILRIGERLVF